MTVAQLAAAVLTLLAEAPGLSRYIIDPDVHIDHWQRDRGRTDVGRGVFLCRHHHMLVHNNGWEITHDRGGFHLIPPTTADPERVPRPMPTKSPAVRDLFGLGA